MSTLKRKDAPGGDRPAKTAKKSKDTTASKDAKTSSKTSSRSATTASTDGQPKPSTVSLLKDEEPMFPRGGGSVLTPLEQKKIHLEAKADAMRDEEFGTSKKSTKTKERKSKTTSKRDKAAGLKPDEDTVKVESLSFKVRATYTPVVVTLC
jgi:rRNA biogenesis protein RRP5